MCRCRFLLLCEFRDDIDERLIGFAVFFAESWDDGAKVGTVELGGGIDFASEKAFAERAEGDEADPELFERGHNGMLGLAPEEGVLALQCSDGLHRVCAADVFCACFREPEVFDFACLDEILDGASSVFDGRVGVDAMLIKEVNGVGPKALERPLDDLLDVVRAAVQGSPLASVRQNRLDVARLTLETLINTYPDSTYASMAKEALQDPVIGNCRDSCAIPAGCHKYAVPETMGPS